MYIQLSWPWLELLHHSETKCRHVLHSLNGGGEFVPMKNHDSPKSRLFLPWSRLIRWRPCRRPAVSRVFMIPLLYVTKKTEQHLLQNWSTCGSLWMRISGWRCWLPFWASTRPCWRRAGKKELTLARLREWGCDLQVRYRASERRCCFALRVSRSSVLCRQTTAHCARVSVGSPRHGFTIATGGFTLC